MTPEGRLTKLEETTLVNSSLIVRLEQNMDRIEGNVELLIQTVGRLARTQADGFAELRASQAALFDRIDRFMRGEDGNGRKK